MRVRDTMQRPVEVLRKDATLCDAAFLSRYYRLTVAPAYGWPVRGRREAVFDFVSIFPGRFKQQFGLSKTIEADAVWTMDWPGNVCLWCKSLVSK